MKRFIEESFPVKEVSAESARDKNIRHGHISALHIWWARRPLASSRATAYAALIPPSKDAEEWNAKRNFISDLSKWENSLNPHLIETARKEILEANGGVPPKVLDPFGGGGAIPLEALRLGCETYSNDLNPVAVLIQKCTLEYPQKYGKPKEVESNQTLHGVAMQNPLLEDFKKWGEWVLAEAKRELERFYPLEDDGSIPVGYMWARTIPCQNPSCGTEIPLMRQFWLANKPKKRVALYPYVENREVRFKIVGDGYEPMPDAFDPAKGSVSRAVAVCPVCGGVVEANLTRKLFQEGKAGERMVAVVTHKSGTSGKRYRAAIDDDIIVFREAEAYLVEMREKLTLESGMDPVPDESMDTKDPNTVAGRGYGFSEWSQLFNARQRLILITLAEGVKKAHQKMMVGGVDGEYAKAVVSYLALCVSRCSDFETTLVRWFNHVENSCNTFARQAIPMLWDFFELNLLSPVSQGTFQSMARQILRTIEFLGRTTYSFAGITTGASATNLPHPDKFFDAVFTDPPYYDNIGYASLSDFFYVWLKRSVGNLYPELFSTPLTPKSNEIISAPHRHGGKNAAKSFFEENLKQSFKEIHRVLKANGIAIIVYAHKSTEGWETPINALLDSGLIMTSAWPLDTEMKGKAMAMDTASLLSSIYIVARKMERQPTGFYNEVKEEMRAHLNAKLQRLWEEGLSGADFFIAAIGSAIEIFGKYEQVMDYEGNIVRADRLLDDVREIATDYAVRQILHNGLRAEISDLTRFYVLWRWEFGEARVDFDNARKLAQSCGIDLAREWGGKGFVAKEKQYIRVQGPQSRKFDDLTHNAELIDTLHRVLLLWEKSQREEMLNLLRDSGYGDNEAFFRVAQAISETLPIESKEKQLLDGFLAGRQRITEDMRQGRLF